MSTAQTTKLAQIVTSYSTNRATGAGRITARFSTGDLKGKRVTVGFDHGARDPHAVAAWALLARHEITPDALSYAGTGNNGGNTYDVTVQAEAPAPVACAWKCGDDRPDHDHFAVVVREGRKLLGRLTPSGHTTNRNVHAAIMSEAKAEKVAAEISAAGEFTAHAVKF